MKNKGLIFKLGLLIAAFLICVLPLNSKEKGKASISFAETTHNFGNIKEKNGPVSYVFKFTNKGDENLIINKAWAECGCTKPDFTEAPIPPGKTGEVKVTYNPLGRPGGFTKVVTVKCNGNPSKVVLKITGTVLPK